MNRVIISRPCVCYICIPIAELLLVIAGSMKPDNRLFPVITCKVWSTREGVDIKRIQSLGPPVVNICKLELASTMYTGNVHERSGIPAHRNILAWNSCS